MTRSSGKRWLRTLALFLLLLAAARFTDCSPTLFWARRSHLTDLISAMLPPDWGYAPRILAPLLATVQMSVTGTALGSFLALLLAPLCAENLHAPKPLRWTLRLLVQVLRSFPTLILALLATFLFGLGTFSGTVAITVYTFAILTRLTYEDIESAELAPYHALCAMGAVPTKVYWRAVVPGIAPSYFSNVLYLLETNVRHSSILGYVGAGGIGLLLNEKISWLEYGKVGMILFFLFLTVCVIEGISGLLSQIIREERSLSPLGKRLLTGAAVLLALVCTLSLQPPDFSHISPRAVQAMISGLLLGDGYQRLGVPAAGDRVHRSGGHLRRNSYRSAPVLPLYPLPDAKAPGAAVPGGHHGDPLCPFPDLRSDLYSGGRSRPLYRRAHSGRLQRWSFEQTVHGGH